jgi:hypothetical protein
LSEEREKKWCVCPDAPHRGGISEYVAPDGAWNFFGCVSTNMPRLTALKKNRGGKNCLALDSDLRRE